MDSPAAPSPPAGAPTPAAAAAPAAPGSERRARLVLTLSAVGAALLMGGLVALAVLGPGDELQGGSPSPARVHEGPPPFVGAPLPPGCLPDPARPPKLEAQVPETGIDFGAVRQGQVVQREVVFRSAGPGALCVRHVETGCGCIKAELKGEQRRFEPGESGVVVLTLDSTGRSGAQKKAFSIVTNELENPRRTWPVTADISLGVIASSHVLDFGRPRRGVPAKATLRLTSPKAEPAWTVTDLVAARTPGQEPPAFAWTAKEVADPALRVVDVEVTHPGRSEDGMWQAAVVLKTSHPDRPEIHLQAVLTIQPPVQATPPAAMFGFVRSGSPDHEQRIALRASAGTKFKVTGVRLEPLPGRSFGPDGPGFTIEQGATADGTPYVAVRYDGRTRRPGLIEALLVVGTDVPEQPEVKVPLKATVAAATAGR